MIRERQMGQPIDLKLALPEIGRTQPYDYDTALRRRLSPIRQKGDAQSDYSSRAAAQAQNKKFAELFAAADKERQDVLNSQPTIAKPNIVTPGGLYLSPIEGLKPTFGYGAPYKTPVAGNTHHQGIDFATPANTRVLSPFGGKIIESGWNNTGFGNNIRIAFDDGNFGILGHLAGLAVKAGDIVTAGQLLGLSGNTGNSTGDHLHFEVRRNLNDPKSAFNPSSLFGW